MADDPTLSSQREQHRTLDLSSPWHQQQKQLQQTPSAPLQQDLTPQSMPEDEGGARALSGRGAGYSSITNSDLLGVKITFKNDHDEELGQLQEEVGMATPAQQPGSPLSSPSTSEEMDLVYRTPPPQPAFTDPPSPPRPEYFLRRRSECLFGNSIVDSGSSGSGGSGSGVFWQENGHVSGTAGKGEAEIARAASPPKFAPHHPQQLPHHHGHLYDTREQQASIYPAATSFLTATKSNSNKFSFEIEQPPRKPLTSIAGSSRCLWPPDSTFLTMSNTFKERAFFQQPQGGPEGGINVGSLASSSTLFSTSPVGAGALLGSSSGEGTVRSGSDALTVGFKGVARDITADCMQELQPRRKARRVMDGPYFKERNHRMVAGHVRKLIQEAVEDGVGELDLSNLELTDLPSEIRDLNYAIVYNERGSFSLSQNRLKLFLSLNQFLTIPMDVFALQNLSVLSIRNNCIEVIPPEIGLLLNLVELSIGGNLLKVLPYQIALLPKLQILTVHPNPFMVPPGPDTEGNNDGNVADPVNEGHDGEVPAAIFNDGGGHATIIPEQQQLQYDNAQHAIPQHQPPLMSPPPSPLFNQNEDVDMVALPDQQEHEGFDSASFPSVALDSQAAGPIQAHFSEALSSQGSFSTSSIITGNSSLESANTSVLEETRGCFLPLHKVTRSRVPTLLILAGNALLNHMDVQEAGATATRETKRGSDRPRKDSKISMDGDEWAECQGFGQEDEYTHQKEQSDCFGSGGSSQSGLLQPKRKRYVFKEATIKSYLTPYLFDNFKRARSNNRCAGCLQRFWKPCRIVVVWQDLLGQTHVPVEWKGCGIGGCLGVPASMWSNSPSASESPLPTTGLSTEQEEARLELSPMSIVASPVLSAASSSSSLAGFGALISDVEEANVSTNMA